ncbi:dendritic arbor reduction protein 1-like [Anopheles bellator]|uniref:dendritic arbor reduction protein 1-like n=1 Tax=Anopheles bellator TaxID=139047 RepID=UPI0026494B0A|nr:dendritic arbor reduction protein 1-like [Anopheles bellator]
MGAASTGAESLECCNSTSQPPPTAENQQLGAGALGRAGQQQQQDGNQQQSAARDPIKPPSSLPLSRSQTDHTSRYQRQQQQQQQLDIANNNSHQQQQQQQEHQEHQGQHLYVNPVQGFLNYELYLKHTLRPDPTEHPEYLNHLNNNHSGSHQPPAVGNGATYTSGVVSTKLAPLATAGTMSLYSEYTVDTPLTLDTSNLSGSCQCLFVRYCRARASRRSSTTAGKGKGCKGDRQLATAPGAAGASLAPVKEQDPKPKPAGGGGGAPMAARNRGGGAGGRGGAGATDTDPLMRRPRRKKDTSEQDLATKQQQPAAQPQHQRHQQQQSTQGGGGADGDDDGSGNPSHPSPTETRSKPEKPENGEVFGPDVEGSDTPWLPLDCFLEAVSIEQTLSHQSQHTQYTSITSGGACKSSLVTSSSRSRRSSSRSNSSSSNKQ